MFNSPKEYPIIYCIQYLKEKLEEDNKTIVAFEAQRIVISNSIYKECVIRAVYYIHAIETLQKLIKDQPVYR